MLFQTSLGIDIQGSSVSVVYLKASFKEVRLTAYATYPLDGGKDVREKVTLISGLVGSFLRENQISPASIFLGIPRHLAILKYLEFPLAAKENLRDSLGYEMERHVPFSADEVYFDYQIVAEDKESGKMRILLIAAKRESIDPYLDIPRQLGLGVSSIEITSTAIANYFSFQPLPDGGDALAVVYLKDDDLEIDLFRKGILDYSRLVRGVGKGERPARLVLHELKALKEGLGIDQDRLKTLFCGFGTDGGMVNDFRDEEDLDIFLPDLSKTGIPSPAMVSAYGLALRGLQKVPMDINILPEGFRKRPSRFGHYTLFVLVCLIILSAIAWGGGNIFFQQLRLSRLNAEIAQLRAEVPRIDKTRAKCKEVEKQIDYLNSLRHGDVTVLDVLKELSQRIPKNAWVMTLTFSDKGVQIHGLAESASGLIPSIEDSPLFKDTAFLSPITRNNKGQEVFRIGLKLG